MLILKVLFAPVSLALTLFTWLSVGLVSCAAFVFKLANALLSLLAVAVLITYSVKNGIILLVIALLISPMRLPMMVFNTLYGFTCWSAYFALCFWRLRLKISRFGA